MTTDQTSEIFKPVIGFEGLYEISNYGRVKSLPRWHPNNYNGYFTKELFLKPKKSHKGYAQFELKRDRIGKNFKRSRLVAIHFILNPEHKEQVNHIDGNRWNDNVSNLEWATQSENIQHSYDFLGRRAAYKGVFGKYHNQSKPVIAIQETSILEFESKTACANYFNVKIQAVCQATKNNKQCKGHRIFTL